MDHLQNAKRLFEEFPLAFLDIQVGFRPLVNTPTDFSPDSPHFKDLGACAELSGLKMDIRNISNDFASEEWQVELNDYFRNLISFARTRRFLRTNAGMRYNDLQWSSRIENLSVLEVEVESEEDASRLEKEENELSGYARTWLKMRFHQLRIASLFSDELTAACRGILNTIQNRTGPVHAYIALLETELRIMILFANNRFQRGYELARQQAGVLQDFLHGRAPPIMKQRIIPQPLRNDFTAFASLPLHKIFSRLFPLTETTVMDTFFHFTDFQPSPVQHVEPKQAVYYTTPNGRRVNRLEMERGLFDIVLQKLKQLSTENDPEDRAVFLKAFRELLNGIIRNQGVEVWKTKRQYDAINPNHRKLIFKRHNTRPPHGAGTGRNGHL